MLSQQTSMVCTLLRQNKHCLSGILQLFFAPGAQQKRPRLLLKWMYEDFCSPLQSCR